VLLLHLTTKIVSKRNTRVDLKRGLGLDAPRRFWAAQCPPWRAWGFGGISTSRSNGTNKVIDTPCTSCYSFPCIPNLILAWLSLLAARFPCPFASLHFCLHLTLFFPGSSALFRHSLFQECSPNLLKSERSALFCKIPGIGYPPPSIFLDSFSIRSPQSSTVALRSASARNAHFCAITPLLVTLAQKQGGGGVT
jgi:hypothetical protein